MRRWSTLDVLEKHSCLIGKYLQYVQFPVASQILKYRDTEMQGCGSSAAVQLLIWSLCPTSSESLPDIYRNHISVCTFPVTQNTFGHNQMSWNGSPVDIDDPQYYTTAIQVGLPYRNVLDISIFFHISEY